MALFDKTAIQAAIDTGPRALRTDVDKIFLTSLFTDAEKGLFSTLGNTYPELHWDTTRRAFMWGQGGNNAVDLYLQRQSEDYLEIIAADNSTYKGIHIGGAKFSEVLTPATPAANEAVFYAKDLGSVTLPYWLDSGGQETPVVVSNRPVTFDVDSKNTDETPTLIVGNTTAVGENFRQQWTGGSTDLFLQEINSDDWLFVNNAYYADTVTGWVQPTVTSPSTLYFQASGGQNHAWYTAAAGGGGSLTWAHHMASAYNAGNPILYIGPVAIDAPGDPSAAFPPVQGALIYADDGTGLLNTRAQQLTFLGFTNPNYKFEIGLDSVGGFGLIQCVEEGVGWRDVLLALNGGNVGLGLTQPAEKFHVNGNVRTPGYVEIGDISAPTFASVGGRLYSDTSDKQLYWAHSTGTTHSVSNPPRSIQIQPFAPTTSWTTGDGKGYLTIDQQVAGMNLVSVHIRAITAGVTGVSTVQLHNVTQAADMLTTRVTLDTTETGSDTAATPYVIDTANDDVALWDLLRVDVDGLHSTPPQGMIVTLEFEAP